MGSREGMNRTTGSSGLYAAWPEVVRTHLAIIRQALDRSGQSVPLEEVTISTRGDVLRHETCN